MIAFPKIRFAVFVRNNWPRCNTASDVTFKSALSLAITQSPG